MEQAYDLVAMAVRTHNDTPIALVIASVIMFACCWARATHLLGVRPALHFVLNAVSFGWFAGQLGAARGGFFGQYTYTEVLPPAGRCTPGHPFAEFKAPRPARRLPGCA